MHMSLRRFPSSLAPFQGSAHVTLPSAERMHKSINPGGPAAGRLTDDGGEALVDEETLWVLWATHLKKFKPASVELCSASASESAEDDEDCSASSDGGEEVVAEDDGDAEPDPVNLPARQADVERCIVLVQGSAGCTWNLRGGGNVAARPFLSEVDAVRFTGQSVTPTSIKHLRAACSEVFEGHALAESVAEGRLAADEVCWREPENEPGAAVEVPEELLQDKVRGVSELALGLLCLW